MDTGLVHIVVIEASTNWALPEVDYLYFIDNFLPIDREPWRSEKLRKYFSRWKKNLKVNHYIATKQILPFSNCSNLEEMKLINITCTNSFMENNSNTMKLTIWYIYTLSFCNSYLVRNKLIINTEKP